MQEMKNSLRLFLPRFHHHVSRIVTIFITLSYELNRQTYYEVTLKSYTYFFIISTYLLMIELQQQNENKQNDGYINQNECLSYELKNPK